MSDTIDLSSLNSFGVGRWSLDVWPASNAATAIRLHDNVMAENSLQTDRNELVRDLYEIRRTRWLAPIQALRETSSSRWSGDHTALCQSPRNPDAYSESPFLIPKCRPGRA